MTENTTAASGAAQSEALRLAAIVNSDGYITNIERRQIAAELRHLHALTTAAPAAQEAEPAVLPVAAKTHGAWDGLEFLDQLPDGTELYAHPPSSRADAEAAEHNWNIIQYFDHWLLEQGALLCNRTEEADGKMAPALNWIDSVKALIDAAPQAPAASTTAAAATYAPLPKPYSAASALGLDDLYTGDDMRAYADAHRGTQAPAAGAAPTDAFWWRKRADEIELAVARSGSTQAMRYYTDMRTLLQAVSLRAAAPAQEAEDAARYRTWRDNMIADSGPEFHRTVAEALPGAVGRDRRPTAAEWDTAIDAARARQEGGA